MYVERMRDIEGRKREKRGIIEMREDMRVRARMPIKRDEGQSCCVKRKLPRL